ncbi:hypothetical protein K435DRAFT_270638 [Dendrothele bispora CBS 962.96]|uniref:Uncharacterized protein n=1 Tax=Dendrothele bispora (strain CBS 962.96) TaxID=1314807 RepID=A0A4S8LMC5_DENBC|nr:hypothetical protein K435DRAFT_270638 [Dendrothele bispora CBS 962.96]
MQRQRYIINRSTFERKAYRSGVARTAGRPRRQARGNGTTAYGNIHPETLTPTWETTCSRPVDTNSWSEKSLHRRQEVAWYPQKGDTGCTNKGAPRAMKRSVTSLGTGHPRRITYLCFEEESDSEDNSVEFSMSRQISCCNFHFLGSVV